jgi:hypothetical protein
MDRRVPSSFWSSICGAGNKQIFFYQQLPVNKAEPLSVAPSSLSLMGPSAAPEQEHAPSADTQTQTHAHTCTHTPLSVAPSSQSVMGPSAAPEQEHARILTPTSVCEASFSTKARRVHTYSKTVVFGHVGLPATTCQWRSPLLRDWYHACQPTGPELASRQTQSTVNYH